MWKRFMVYGCAGWVAEVLFTGTLAAVGEKDRSATAKTYLWMHPIYGLGGLALEWLGRHLDRVPRPVRAAAYVPAIFATEFSTGLVLRKALGRCPWDYTGRGIHAWGLIRLDYAPVWYALALVFEPLAGRLRLLVEGTAAEGTPANSQPVASGSRDLPTPDGPTGVFAS